MSEERSHPTHEENDQIAMIHIYNARAFSVIQYDVTAVTRYENSKMEIRCYDRLGSNIRKRYPRLINPKRTPYGQFYYWSYYVLFNFAI